MRGIRTFSVATRQVRAHACAELVRRFNADPAVHGILVQLPLPKHVDEAATDLAVQQALAAELSHRLRACSDCSSVCILRLFSSRDKSSNEGLLSPLLCINLSNSIGLSRINLISCIRLFSLAYAKVNQSFVFSKSLFLLKKRDPIIEIS